MFFGIKWRQWLVFVGLAHWAVSALIAIKFDDITTVVRDERSTRAHP